MTEEMMQEEVVEETVDETTEEEVNPTDTEEVENTETEETQEEEPFDWKSLELKHLDEVKQLGEYTPEDAASMFRKGIDYDRKVSKYEEKLNAPHYKWVDEYMKSNGFTDGTDFVKAIQVNDKKSSLMEKGMSEEDAQAEAEEYVNKTFGQKTDQKTKEIDGFLKWHQGKVDSGKFNESLNVDSIPKQVIEAYEKGENIKEAYMDYLLDDIKVSTEQETIKKITKNKETSTGKLKPNAATETKLSSKQIEDKINSLSSSAEKQRWIKNNMEMIEKSGYFN